MSEETYWQIQDFLQGRLKDAQLEDFQSRLSSNPDLMSELEIHKFADQLLSDKKLQTISAISLQTQSKIKQNILVKKLLVASVGIISLGILTYILSTNNINTVVKDKSDSIFIHKKSETKGIISGQPEIQSIKYEEKRLTLNLKKTFNNVDTILNKVEIDTTYIKTNFNSKASDVEVIKTQEVVTSTIDICKDLSITASVTVKNSCANESNGIIYVNSFKGGKAPYHFKILTADKKENNSQEVSKGKYDVVISDVNNCEKRYSDIVVKEIVCLEEEKSFNPSIGEILELGETKIPVALSVLTKNGEVLYLKEFRQNEKIEWNGITNSGNIESGYFIYYLKYTDGTVKHGEITVTP
ncbi:MAG: hypothetical protein H7329_10420 [Opitutaceae bacterium]|nr:hypothetical protein [Cytophagales bacterium]